MAQAIILLCTSPKSNSAEIAIDSALTDIRNGNVGNIPRHLQNKHYDGEDASIKGQHYLYPHDFSDHYVKQQYLPDKIKNKVYYQFGDNKTEQSASEYRKKILKG